VFQVHRRTRARTEGGGLAADGLILTESLGYLEFLRLMSEARLRAAREALDAPLWRVEPPQLWDGKATGVHR